MLYGIKLFFFVLKHMGNPWCNSNWRCFLVMMRLWFVLEEYDLVKFEVLDKVSGMSMVPKCTINLGKSAVKFIVFIKNS